MIVLELAESFLPRECSGAERDGWGDDRGLAAKRRKTRKNRMGRLTAEDGRRTTEDGQRRVGRQEAQNAQESDGTAQDGWRKAGFDDRRRKTDGGRRRTEGVVQAKQACA